MRHFTLLALLLAFTPAHAALKPIDAQENQHASIAVNGGFENGSYGWTASGGATKTANATAKGLGSFGYDWDSNAAAQTLTSSLVTIPAGLQGKNGLAYCSIKAASGSPTHTITVDDGTNPLATAQTIATSTSTFTKNFVNFIYPNSGSVRLKLASVASDEPEIYIDDCYIGPASNLSEVSQSTFYGSLTYPATASCNYSTTSTTFANFSANASCPTPTLLANAAAPATKIPAITFSNGLPPGRYYIVATGSFRKDSTANESTWMRFSDGTNSTTPNLIFNSAAAGSAPSITGELTYTTAQAGPLTIQMQGKSQAGTANPNIEMSANDLTISVYRFPTSSETAYRSDKNPLLWSGYHDSTCTWTVTSTTYANFTADATCALVERHNVNFGTVSTSGSVLPAITFTPPRAGRYSVCAFPKPWMSVSAAVGIRLWDGTATIAESEQSATSRMTIPVCGFYYASSATSVTLSLQAKSSSGTLTIDPGGSASAVEWMIQEAAGQAAAPVFVGSVTSNTAGQERVERANFNGSNCAINTQSGSWLSSTSGSTSTGCTVNFTSGMFSAAPTCVCSVRTGSGVDRQCTVISAATTSSVQIKSSTDNSDLNLVCMGPR